MEGSLEHYLKYYCDLESPEFAILVTGPWGVGKTYQVRKLLPPCKSHYISLFGLTTVSEIHDAVLTEVEPTLATAKKYLPAIVSTLATALQIPHLKSLTPGLCQALLRKRIKPTKILIFDDLERCTVFAPDLLGAINTYIEHHKCKVVIVAHDSGVISQDRELMNTLETQKEKIIGQTIRVIPDAESAFQNFRSRYSCEAFISFLADYKNDILAVFAESEVDSLRMLRSSMDDLSRLYEALDEKHLCNAEAIKELISLHIALNLEVRSRSLTKEDLVNRTNSKFRHLFGSSHESMDEEKGSSILRSDRKYKYINLGSNYINDEVAIEMLIYGTYSSERIQHSVDNSVHFLPVEAEETPAWKVVWQFDRLEDSIVDAAREDMEKQFRERDIAEPAEFLHVFALRMMMAENAVIKATVEEVFEECREYVNDLAKDRRLPPSKLETEGPELALDMHDGFGYWIMDSYEEYFAKLREHVKEKRQIMLDERLPVMATELLNELRVDAEKFAETISSSASKAGRFAANAILHKIEPAEFVSAWLGNKREKWHYVKGALEYRYSLAGKFGDENDWMKQVIVALEEAAKSEDGLRALRIRRIMPTVPALEED